MKLKFYDNCGNEVVIEGKDREECMHKFISDLDVVWVELDEDGNEIIEE